MRARSKLYKRAEFAVFIAVISCAAVPLVALAPFIEARINPVIFPIEETFTREGRTIYVQSDFTKQRGHCVIDKAQFDYLPDAGPSLSVSRNAKLNRSNGGPAKLGTPYVLTPDATFPGYLRRTFWYRCHTLYLTPYHFPDLRID